MAHRATRPHEPAGRRERSRAQDAIAQDFKPASQEQIFETQFALAEVEFEMWFVY
jgi:hypothetical protein